MAASSSWFHPTPAKVHDTRLMAAMNVHGIKRILTFNTGDFTCFAVEAINPATLLT
jgi:hypothetical protein